ncbi:MULTISPECIES: bifunctional proline dehydrogenase/L-glutamate gamma-semialdehyde dehydrogenase [Microbacterium]|uniref:bifunctional proline dehydrogenase/L-glutamate gamma-semialdehyde dehydrogenase n=1 Tax=Microbacterium TaxID=33882 RepID=UPI00217D2A30|nr:MULTISPECIES: bifunctional proline dehydrogenase/L-glutamate gamma-semialdehyde dehydrogenase [Microbacterium]UWF77304.1 bifunctional proline dehydrogenase/L-glutamate gamma-semialdehyde dehydrogenase [Microbacterium neungamense]WCM55462.1 bifunctional proline dehydrogenase/L-glutamate gamma-semialdehyde dehydrogenase [Microbacterium sp. EF45047]
MAEESSSGPGQRLADAAVELARRWVQETAVTPADPAAARLTEVLRDPHGLQFMIGFVDGVMRPESLTAAAANLQRVAPLAPGFLPWYLRGVVRLGGAVAPVIPAPTVPIARRVLREMVGHLIVDARPDKLGPALQRVRESAAGGTGVRLNLNLLGEAVLGEAEARRRLDGIHELIRREDVDHVSVKVSAIMSRISLWAFDEVVDATVERLLPLYLTAASQGPTFLNLDMEEYKDLDLTIAVFTRILEDPRLKHLSAGIAIQAYLPDALPALRELTAWARDRVEHGGAPIKVRLVKGANLPMEKVDAVMHGWPQAPYQSKLDTDANYLRCLDEALQPRNTAAVRVGVAGHNLFDIAYAWLLAGERGVREAVEFEMLLGMAQAQVAAVSREVGGVLLYVPVVRPDEFDVAISYLVRRLEENASPSNFLSAAFHLADDPSLFERERLRFLDSVARSADDTLRIGPRRTQDRTAPVHEAVRPVAPAPASDVDLTRAVLGISRGSDAGGDPFLETAVYSRQEAAAAARAEGAPGFANTPDSDPSLAANREWARGILARIADADAGGAALGASALREARIEDPDMLDRAVQRVRDASVGWGSRPAAERAEILQRAAAALEARRGELIEVAAVETGKVFAEADIEVSEAVDFAKYYAATARELDGVTGAVFVPARVTVVAPPWNFPLAIPAGGVLAALAAGSGVVLKPAPQARRCAAVIAETLWQAGIPRDVLALVDIDEGDLGRQLIAHPDVERVILTGSWDTAALFRSWRPDLPLLAETSGKNAMIIAPTADLDLAVADLVRSAFGHAGQKCSAASLAILVGPVGRSKRFRRQLVDATRSLHVAWPSDPRAEVGPVIERPQGKLAWALTELEGDEQWLVKPRPVPGDESGRLWTPGIRVGVQPGSRMHLEEFFGPVLGIMHAPTLARAIDLQNAVPFGLTAGLCTQDPDDLALWLDRAQAGNLYVNRGITGAIVQRQPFGGWKRSSVGPGAKVGGANYLIRLGSWRSRPRGKSSSTLHLRGLDSRISALIESAQPSLDFDAFEWLRQSALSDAVVWDREFGQVRDVSRLGVERNLFRYRPVPVALRATADAPLQEVLRVVIAGIRSGARFLLSVPKGLPAAVRRELGGLDVLVAVESDAEWIDRMARRHETPAEPASATPPETDAEADVAPAALAAIARVRLIGGREAVAALHRDLARAVNGDPGLAVYDDEVTSAGRLELLPFVHEQSVTITAHRFGNPDDWSSGVI